MTQPDLWQAAVTRIGQPAGVPIPLAEVASIVSAATGIEQTPEVDDEAHGLYLVQITKEQRKKLIRNHEITLFTPGGLGQVYIDAGEVLR